MSTQIPLTVLSRKTLIVRRRKRRTNEELRPLFRTPVILECPAESDFPLAVQVFDGGRPRGQQLVDFRHFRGRNFTPVLVRRDNGAVCNFPARLVASAFERGAFVEGLGHWQSPFLSESLAEPHAALDEPLPNDVAEVVHDSEQQRVSEINHIAARLLVFGGTLWEHAPEPVFRVAEPVGIWTDGKIDVTRQLARLPLSAGTFLFRLDRLEAAKSFAFACSKKPPKIGEEELKYVDARLLVRDDRICTASGLADRVSTQVRFRWLKLLDPTEVRPLVKLIELSVQATESVQVIESAIGQLLRTLNGLDLNEHGSQALEHTLQQLRPAILRYTDYEGGNLDGDPLTESDLSLLGELA